MALIQMKPTSPGRRHQVKVTTPGLHKGDPHFPLVEKQGALQVVVITTAT